MLASTGDASDSPITQRPIISQIDNIQYFDGIFLNVIDLNVMTAEYKMQ